MGRKTRPSRRKTLSSASALLAPSQCTDWGAVGGGFASPAPPAAAGRPPGPTALTFTSLHSRESVKAGNISSYFCTASWRTAPRWGWGRLQDPPPPAPPFPPPTPLSLPPTLALSMSMQKWQSAALKKYSLALYLRRGLSMALVPTCGGNQGHRGTHRHHLWGTGVWGAHKRCFWMQGPRLLVSQSSLLYSSTSGAEGPSYGAEDTEVPLTAASGAEGHSYGAEGPQLWGRGTQLRGRGH